MKNIKKILFAFYVFPLISFSQTPIKLDTVTGDFNFPMFMGHHAGRNISTEPYNRDTIVGIVYPPDKEFIFNTFIGLHAGKNVRTGSYNFVVGEDSTAVNINENTSYFWYIQPNAKYFKLNPECLICLLLIHPCAYDTLPKIEAIELIKKGRKCLNLNIE